MKTIRISLETYEGLKSLSTFEDTPDAIIKRLLKDYGVQLRPTTPETLKAEKRKNGKITPQVEYEKFLLQVMAKNFNGRGSKKEITDYVIDEMKKKDILTEKDFEAVSTGESRAQNTTAWARNRLKESGLISSDSARGVWELTKAGFKEANNQFNLRTY